MAALPLEGKAVVKRNASHEGKVQIANVLAYTMVDFTYAEKENMRCMHGFSNGRAVLRMYHSQFDESRVTELFSDYIGNLVK